METGVGMDLPRADLGAAPAYLGQGGLADFRSQSDAGSRAVPG